MKTTNFLDLKNTAIDQSRYVITPIPFEGKVSYLPGASKGPSAILEASSQVEYYDFQYDVDMENETFHTVEAPGLNSFKDVSEHIESVFSKLDTEKQFYLGIGGDHTITIPAISALSKKYKNLGIVQIDAHADLRDTLDDDKYSHACIMRRNVEMIGPENILQIGIRAVCQEEKDYITKHGVKHVPGNFPLHEDLVPKIKDHLSKLPENIFITVDLDGLDPTIMPHVGTPVPGGLTWAQTLDVLNEVFKTKKVVAADVVEIASGKDSERSDFTAALLCQKIVALHKKYN